MLTHYWTEVEMQEIEKETLDRFCYYAVNNS